MDPKIDKVASGFQAAGPVYSRIGYLLVSDTSNGKIVKWQSGALTVFRGNSNGASGLTFDHQGRLLTSERDRVTRTEKNGAVTVLAAGYRDPSDLVYAIDGNIYFTDAAGVHRIKPKGGAEAASRECAHPAGVALAPNQQKLYVADNGERNVRVFDIAADGKLKNGRVFAKIEKGGPLGGLKTDEMGSVWLAGPGGIWTFDKEGKFNSHVPLPESPNNLNWGAGFSNIFATTNAAVYKIEAKTNGTRTY